MRAKSVQRKLGTTRGRPRRTRTAKASRINRTAAKWRCAGEWGGWGRISEDGPGHYNPVRSEGPWGRATPCRSNSGEPPVRPSDTERNKVSSLGVHEGRIQTMRSEANAGCRLNPSVAWEGTV